MSKGELPRSWSVVELDGLRAEGPYTLVGGPFGSDLTQNDYVSKPGVPVIRGTNLGGKDSRFVDEGFVYVSESKARSLRRNMAFPGDLVFTQRGTLGQVAVIPRKARFQQYVISQSQMKLTPNPSRVDAAFLYQYFRAPRTLDRLLSQTQATGVPHISLGILKHFPVTLPPLAEQRRIADVLDRAEALRAKRRAALAQLDTLTQAIFLDLFGDPATNPKAWPERSIAELCRVQGGKRLPKGEDYSATPTSFRYIRVTDLKGGVVDEAALVYLKPEVQARIARYIVNTGDVIISIAGSIGLVGPVPSSLDGANLTENAAKLVHRDRDTYDAGFLAAFLQTPFAQNQISSHIGQVTIGKLALFRIEKLRVPLPPPSLQCEFARRVGAVEKLKAAQRASLAELDTLFDTLQHRAFRGEL